MKKTAFVYLMILLNLAFINQKCYGGVYSAIDKKVLQIPDSLTASTDGISGYINSNFHTNKEKVRAIYIWLASIIEYDINNMYAINFYETMEEKISKSLKTRKGICINYSALFNELCTKCGIKSYIITGYTEQYGFKDYIPHAWCSAYIDSVWYVFDPTWGSGYITDEGKFYRQVNEKYFLAKPSYLIRSHMPFDYLWQFMNYIVTNQEFYNRKISQERRPYFNFTDSIKEYDKQTHSEQLAASARRIEANGVKNSMIFDMLHHIKLEIEHESKSKNMKAYNSAVNNYNEGIRVLNSFIRFKNKRFIPEKTDSEIQSIVDSSQYTLNESRKSLAEITDPDSSTLEMTNQLRKSIDEVDVQLKEQQDWLNQYLKKGKTGRKLMFYDKINLYGIPLK